MGSHIYSCQSLLLSIIILNDIYNMDMRDLPDTYIRISKLRAAVHRMLAYTVYKVYLVAV